MSLMLSAAKFGAFVTSWTRAIHGGHIDDNFIVTGAAHMTPSRPSQNGFSLAEARDILFLDS